MVWSAYKRQNRVGYSSSLILLLLLVLFCYISNWWSASCTFYQTLCSFQFSCDACKSWVRHLLSKWTLQLSVTDFQCLAQKIPGDEEHPLRYNLSSLLQKLWFREKGPSIRSFKRCISRKTCLLGRYVHSECCSKTFTFNFKPSLSFVNIFIPNMCIYLHIE